MTYQDFRHSTPIDMLDERFYEIPYEIRNSEKFQKLLWTSYNLLIGLLSIYDGSNNGQLSLSAKQAAKCCRCCTNTVKRTFQKLQESGFLEKTKPSTYYPDEARPAQWRITWIDD